MIDLTGAPEMLPVPVLNIDIPECNVAWAYGAFTNVLLQTIEDQLDGAFDELSNVWAAWEGDQSRVWSSSFDLVTAMGHDNPLLSQRRKSDRFYRGVYQQYRDALSESIRQRDLATQIKIRMEIEKQRQDQYNQQKTTELAYAQTVLQTIVTKYNLVASAYAATVAAFAAQKTRLNALVEQAALVVAFYTAEVEAENVKVDVNRAKVKVYDAEVAVIKSQLELANANLEADRVRLRIDATNIEIQRQQVQELIAGTELVLEDAKRIGIDADIAITVASEREVEVLRARLDTLNSEVDALEVTTAAKKTMYDTSIANRKQTILDLTAANTEQSAAEASFVDAQVELSQHDLQYTYIQNSTNLEKIQNAGAVETENIYTSLIRPVYSDKLDTVVAIQKLGLMVNEYFNSQQLEEARKKAAVLLKDAKIVNKFTEHR